MASRRVRKYKSLSNYLESLSIDARETRIRNDYAAVGETAVGATQLADEVQLVDKALQSSNYVSGASGWAIFGDGNAEFENAYIRGDINATTGTIGYWRISPPVVQRTFGNTTLFGTFLESSDLGFDDGEVDTGTYVSLFKSYEDEPLNFSAVSVASNFVTITVRNHGFDVGDSVVVTFEDSATYSDYNTREVSPGIVVSSTDDTITYSVGALNEDGASDIETTDASGEIYRYVEDVAGLYLRDYKVRNFDYGYFSNKGIQYQSPFKLNFVHNPSFEYINDADNNPLPEDFSSSSVSWTFPTASQASTTFPSSDNLWVSAPLATSGYATVAGGVIWTTSAITATDYLKATIDGPAFRTYAIGGPDKTLYLGFDMFSIDWYVDYEDNDPALGALYDIYVAMELSELKLQFSNGSTVDIYDVLTDEYRAEWLNNGNTQGDYTSWIYSFEGGKLLTWQNPALRLSSNRIKDKYQSLDPAGFVANSNINILFPPYLYSQTSGTIIQDFSTTTKVVGTSTKKIGYGIDSVFLSDTNRFFFGSETYSSDYGWLQIDGTISRTITSPEFPSVEISTASWISLDLDQQSFTLNQVDEIVLDSRAQRKMMYEPRLYATGLTSMSLFSTEAINDSVTYGTPLTQARFFGGQYQKSSGDFISFYYGSSDFQFSTESSEFRTFSKFDYSYLGNPQPQFSEAFSVGLSKFDRAYAEFGSTTGYEGAIVSQAVNTTKIVTKTSDSLADLSVYTKTFNVKIDDGTESETYETAVTADISTLNIYKPIRFLGTLVDASLTSTGHPLQIGASSGTHLKIDSNELQAVSGSNAATTLTLNPAGGTVSVGTTGSVLDINGQMSYIYGYNNAVTGRDLYVSSGGVVGYLSSTRAVKRDIDSAEIDVNAVLSIDPKKFKYVPGHLASGDEDALQIGFVAEDLHDAGLTLFVDYNENTGAIDGIKYNRYVVALQAVVRDQQAKIDSLESRVAALGG